MTTSDIIWDHLHNILYQFSKVYYYEDHYDKIIQIKLEIIHLLSFLSGRTEKKRESNLFYIKEYFKDENILKILEITDKYRVGDYESIKHSLYKIKNLF